MILELILNDQLAFALRLVVQEAALVGVGSVAPTFVFPLAVLLKVLRLSLIKLARLSFEDYCQISVTDKDITALADLECAL